MHLRSLVFRADTYPSEDRYPFNLPVFRRTGRIDFDSPVTLFAGENGSGKSTLLEALAAACGIHIWREPERRRLEVNPCEDSLSRCLSVEWAEGPVRGSFFGSAVFRDFARALDEWAAADPGLIGYYGGRSLVAQSHGQSIMAYFRNRYRIKGLYLLDEPETALSPRTQLELLELLAEAGGAGHAQFVVASHSPILLSCPKALIYSFDRAKIEPVAYEETEHYRIYRDFFERHEHPIGGPRKEERR